jgi:hypothetical protein
MAKVTLAAAICLFVVATGANAHEAQISRTQTAAICESGQLPCGHYCYNPSQGQQCLSGYVCGSGQQWCESVGACYTPSQGETCN